MWTLDPADLRECPGRNRRGTTIDGGTRFVAVKLRLVRMGKKKQPTYRMVAADSRSPRDGRFLEIVGTYAPRGKSTTERDMVLTVDNAKAYFDPSTLITKKKKKSLTLLFEMPRLKRNFADFLHSQANTRYLQPKAQRA